MNNLYFIRLIAKAFEQPDIKTALKEAFNQIELLGQTPQYKQGYLRFQRFMAEVKQISETEDFLNAMVHDLSVQLATGLFEAVEDEKKAALELINSRPLWREEYAMLCEDSEKAESFIEEINVIMEKDGNILCCFPVEDKSVTRHIHNIKPGNYTVKLDTGRIIWEDRLTERDLLWVYAYPEQGLRLAADTGESIALKTRDIQLLDGDITVEVYPGIESGRIELKLRGMHHA